MANNIIFVGLDVDDKNFHGCAYYPGNKEKIEFKCRPTIGHLVKKLNKIAEEGYEIRICYEATYLGYTLCRDLMKKDYWCDVIAPSLTPYQPGRRQKTDKIDCRKLAEYYANGQLTRVVVPDESMERVRDLIRSRNFFGKQLKALKLHILSECRRCGINYKVLKEGKKRNYWTYVHRQWLKAAIQAQGDINLKSNFEMMLENLSRLEETIKSYDKYIEEIAHQEAYKEKVQALSCYRGINILTAMTLITEIGDINRFSHPRKLVGYAGFDLREYSSGDKEKRYGISKMGNRYIRTNVVEACQSAKQRPQINRRLKLLHSKVDQKYVEVSIHCMKRLYEKSRRLIQRDKERNKVKVACAREMLCFIWETLRLAAT